MLVQQKRSMDSFVRVKSFLDEHPVTGPLTYAEARAALEQVMERLSEFRGAQVSGRELSRAELFHQRKLVKRLRDRHMRPIVTIARAQIRPQHDGRLPVALRMPRVPLGVMETVQACEGMIEAAQPYEALFVTHGLPSDFLAQFRAALAELERVVGGRAALIGAHVGARQGLREEVRNGRRVVDRLDAIVRASFEGDTVVLARWRVAKRIGRGFGGSGTNLPVEAEVPTVPRGPEMAVAA